MVFGSLTCHHITLTSVFLIQNDPSKKKRRFLHTSAGYKFTVVTQTSFYFENQNKAKRCSFFCLIFPHFIPISVSFSRSLSAPCLLAHACVNRQLGTRRFPSHLSLQKNKKNKKNLKISSKIWSFWERDPPHPDPENNQLKTSPTFFSFPPPSTSAMAGWQEKRGERGRKEGETAPTQSSQSTGYMMLICNREVVCRMFALYISACIEVLNCAMLSIAEQRMQFNM